MTENTQQATDVDPLWNRAAQEGNAVVDRENTAMAITAIAEQSADQIALDEKLLDAMTPGAVIEFEPSEAERAGAFVEDALGEEDALDSVIDNMEDHG